MHSDRNPDAAARPLRARARAALAVPVLAAAALLPGASLGAPPTAVAPHLPHRILVDGVLDEWDTGHPLLLDSADRSLPLRRAEGLPTWGGPADSSARLFVSWDDERLHFGGLVVDDRPFLSTGRLFLGDSIEVFLRMPEGRARVDYQLILGPLAQDVRWIFARFRGRSGLTDGGFDGVEVAGKEVRDEAGTYRGYTFEAAVPWANFPGFEPSGAQVGFNLALVDADDGPEQKSYLLWAGDRPPAYDPSALGVLRMDGTRAAKGADGGGGLPTTLVEEWKVPAYILLGTVLLLALLWALRSPLRALGDLPFRRKLVLVAVLAPLLAGVRFVPGFVEAKRRGRLETRLEEARATLVRVAADAAEARLLSPGREDSGSPVVRLLERRRLGPLPEYAWTPLSPVARPLRRTLGGGVPVRDTSIPLDAAGRASFLLPEPAEAASLVLVVSYRAPRDGRAVPPAGVAVGRVTTVAADGTSDELELRMGREVDDEESIRADAHGATEARVAWIDLDPREPGDPPLGHADEVAWTLPRGPKTLREILVEQVVPEGVLTLRGVTLLPPGGAEPGPVPLGRTTQDGALTATWNGRPSSEVLAVDPDSPRAAIPVERSADLVLVIYGSPGYAPERAGARVASLQLRMEDGTLGPPLFLENGVHLDGERLAGLEHPADFAGTMAFRWPAPDGVQLHRDVAALPVPSAPGTAVKAVEIEYLGEGTRLWVDGVTAGLRKRRPPATGLTTLERRGDGYELSSTVTASLEGIAVTRYRRGKAVATTLPPEARDRVMGTEIPLEGSAGDGVGEGAAGGGVYERTVAGRRYLALQTPLPFRETDGVLEAAAPAPDAADTEPWVLGATGVLLALLLPLAMTGAIDLLDFLPKLRWKLAGAFGIAAVAPLVLLTLLLARHFEARVDRGIDQEIRAQAVAVSRALAARAEEARRTAEEMVAEDALLRALEEPDEQARAAQVDAVVRDLARRASGDGGGGARVSLEVARTADGRVVRRQYPLKETPAPFQDLYEPANGLAYRWSRLLATGVARHRAAGGQLRLVVEVPVDDRFLREVRRAGADRAQILLFSPDGYPVAATLDAAGVRSPEAVEARRELAAALRRTRGEPLVRTMEVAGIPHAVAYDLVRSPDDRTVGMIATALPRRPLLDATLGTRDLLLLLGSAVFVLAVLVGNLVTRRIAGPVADLARVARRIERGHLEVRARDDGGGDELGSLAVAFNRMTSQLRVRIGELSRLNESMGTFAATLERPRVLERTLAAFRDSARPDGVAVVLEDRERGGAELAAGFRGERELEPGRLDSAGFLAAAPRAGQARVVPRPAETLEADAAPEGERAMLAGAAAAVLLPFDAGGGRTRGAVVLLQDAPGDTAATSSLDFLAALAHQAGVALENARLYRIAVEDAPTGLYVPAYFKRRLQEEVDRSAEAGRPVSLLLLEVEGLDAVFAREGNDAGHRLLRAAAGRMRAELRRMHLLGRAGRSGVAVLLPETGREAAGEIAGHLRAAVERAPFPGDGAGGEVRLGLTSAVATAPDDAGSAEFLENEAERSLARARAGRRAGAAAEAAATYGPPAGVDPAEAEALGFRSAKSLLLLDALNRIATSDVPVLVLGETGAGKEVVADIVHAKSRRARGPLVKVNCAALPAPLLEAELFGYERGAFTGAERRHAGRFEQAHGGTLFLDEIGEMPTALQVKLLRVLQDRKVERLGGTGPVEVDVRVVAATNRDLPAMVESGAFREDLYFRLNVLSVVVPPLRARREDIPVLAARFLEEATGKQGGGPGGFTPEALDTLFRHPFPGNVRELRNMVERAVVSARGRLVTPRDLAFGQEEPGRLRASPPRPPEPASLPPPPPPPRPRADGAAPSGAASGLSARAARLLERIRERGSMTTRDWSEEAGVSARTGLRDFDELMDRGLVERMGKRRAASYRIP